MYRVDLAVPVKMHQLTTFRVSMQSDSEVELPDLPYRPLRRPQRMAASEANDSFGSFLK